MMIQKFRWINERDITTNENQIFLQNKINELVDVINAITIDVDGTKCVDGSKSAAKNMQDELDRTRKALEIAVNALKTVRRYTAINQFAPKSREAHIVAKKALEQITAEQKE